MGTYVIFRHGSNGANQSMCNKAPVAVVEATTRAKAIDTAWELSRNGRFTVYNNQFISAEPKSKLPAHVFDAACEEDMANEEQERFYEAEGRTKVAQRQ